MSLTKLQTIRGYSAASGKPFECALTPKTQQGKRDSTPYSAVSRPIFDMLAGRADWQATKKLVASRRHESKPDVAANDSFPVALIIPDTNNPTCGFAVRLPLAGDVVAAVRLSADAKGWVAEPVALHNDGLEGHVAVHFKSPSVAALLELTERAFENLMCKPGQAAANLDYLCKTGALFTPVAPDKRPWTVACRWPAWQQRKLGFPARKIELGALDSSSEDDGALRQLCSRALHLRTSDTTDS